MKCVEDNAVCRQKGISQQIPSQLELAISSRHLLNTWQILKKNGLHFIIFYVKYVYDCNTFVWKQFQTLSQCMDVVDKEDNFTYGNLACY